jgi:hypothetical protein
VIKFAPVWVTSNNEPLNDIPIREGNAFTHQLDARERATIVRPADTTEHIIDMGHDPGEVSVLLNGEPTNDWERLTPTTIRINTPANLMHGDPFEFSLDRDLALTYERIAGDLPPGLRLSKEGLIVGALGFVDDRIDSFTFTVRARSSRRAVTDRRFVLRVDPLQTFQEVILSSLPSPVTDPLYGYVFHPMGSYKRADAFTHSVDFTHSEGDEELAIVPVYLSGTDYNTLPPGLRIVGTTIKGTISANAPPGRYVFGVALKHQLDGLANRHLEIIVEAALSENIAAPEVIEWITPEGFIGDIREGYSSTIRVKAKHPKGAVGYRLAPSSLPLPEGMRLNPVSGEIEGLAPHVDDDTTFEVTLRATYGNNFSDRRFSMVVRNLYLTSEILDVRLKLRSRDRSEIAGKYTDLIPGTKLYRPSDPAFGMPQPFIYLIKGVASGPFIEALKGDGSEQISREKDYHGRMDLILGKHTFAVVRDEAGDIRYEVIYREVIDPLAKAGGFDFSSNDASEQKVIHAQSQKVIYTPSLRNARLDLIRDCEFPTRNTKVRRKHGPGSAESLPEWMTSPQESDDPSSVLGFTPGLVIAHVAPGEAGALTKILNDSPDLPPPGKRVTLDRYYLHTISYASPTIFDDGLLVLDGPPDTPTPVTFDAESVDEETPIRIG